MSTLFAEKGIFEFERQIDLHRTKYISIPTHRTGYLPPQIDYIVPVNLMIMRGSYLRWCCSCSALPDNDVIVAIIFTFYSSRDKSRNNRADGPYAWKYIAYIAYKRRDRCRLSR